jgi:acetyl esterase/lipase
MRAVRAATWLRSLSRACIAFSLFLVIEACGSGFEPATVGRIDLSQTLLTVVLGDSVRLTALLQDDQGNPISDVQPAWSSSNRSVAEVSPTGMIRGVGVGDATIQAAAQGRSAAAQVRVRAIGGTRFSIVPTPATILVGTRAKMAALVHDAIGRSTDASVAWSSSDPSVATIGADGEVTALTLGTTTITAAGEGETVTAPLAVSDVPVASVELTPASTSVPLGNVVEFTAVAKDAGGNILAGRIINFRTGDPRKAVICADGHATGSGEGVVTITAESEGKSDTSTLTVTPALVATVDVAPSTATIGVNGTVQLTATVKDAYGIALTGRTVSWGTSASGVATVSTSGLVTGKGGGQATITATSDGKSGTALITVTATGGTPATVEVTPGSAMVAAGGGKAQLTATVRDGNGVVLPNSPVTWSSSGSAATVSSTGLVTGSAQGTVTITATSGGKSGTASVIVSKAAGVYGTQGYCASHTQRKMDIYVPAASFARPLPVAVFFHGGAWQSGDKSSSGWRFTSVKNELLARGYIVANVNYRLATSTTNKWPAQIEDAKCAVRSIRGNAGTWGADPARFGAWGTSAGAHLAALLGLTDPSAGFEGPGWTSQSSRVQAVVDMAAPTDLTRTGELHFDYTQVFTSTSQYGPASPVNYVTGDDGAFLIMHGTNDAVVDVIQSNRLHNLLQLAGVGSTFQSITNADHAFEPAASISPNQSQIVQQVANFFDVNVKTLPQTAPVFLAASLRPYSEDAP